LQHSDNQVGQTKGRPIKYPRTFYVFVITAKPYYFI
jgi:hypothetical protein